jgi:uncharacterized protein YbjT (DUF2867 family)
MAPKAVLITGATGKQGGAVIDALLKANAPYEILALTRDAQSPSSKRLVQKSTSIKLITGDLNAADEIFKKAREATKTRVWGVFSVQVRSYFVLSSFCFRMYPIKRTKSISFTKDTNKIYSSKQAVGKAEETQGKALLDAALNNGVSHFVYSSADRGGSNSDHDATRVPHFRTKHHIEQHIIAQTQARNSSTYTILRPVAFFENLSPDFFGKVFTTAWAVKLPVNRKLQLISTRDVGFFGAQALLKSEESAFRNVSMSLAGEALSFEEFGKVFEKTTGETLPMTYRVIARILCGLSKELGYMFDWFREVGFGADIEACARVHPRMKRFEEWLVTESAWKKD